MTPTNDITVRDLLELPPGAWSAADLALARDFLGVTQAELAAKIGYDRSAIAKIEGGDTPPRLVVELAVRYLVERQPEGSRFAARARPEVSFFRSGDEPIGVSEIGLRGNNTVEVYLQKGPAVWFRLMPEFDPGHSFSTIEIKKAATQGGFPLVQLIDGYSNLGFVRASDGFGVFGMIGDRSTTTAVSFVFETGEIWSVDTYIVDAARSHHPNGTQRTGMPYLEDRFKYAAHSFRILLARLGLQPPLRWIAGMDGIADMGLYYPARKGHYFPFPGPQGRSLVPLVYETGIMNESDSAASALQPFFEKVFDKFDVERPEYLDDLSNPR